MSEKLQGNNCPKCGKDDWKGIPDSLAEACSCGFVRVWSDDNFVKGASIQEWAHDVYGIPLPKEDK